MEGHRCHLEGKAHQQKDHPCPEQPWLLRDGLRKEPCDLGEVGRARCAVGQRNPVDQYRRGEAAKEEVLERRFARLLALGVERHQYVERNRKNFKSQEDHDEVVGLGHEHGSSRGAQRQDVILGRPDTFANEIRVTNKRGQDKRRTDRDGTEHRKAVKTDGMSNRGGRTLGVHSMPTHKGRSQSCDSSRDREAGSDIALEATTNEGGGTENDDRPTQENQDRENRQVVDVRQVHLARSGT